MNTSGCTCFRLNEAQFNFRKTFNYMFRSMLKEFKNILEYLNNTNILLTVITINNKTVHINYCNKISNQ